jgi:multiple sugar transport system permease protein
MIKNPSRNWFRQLQAMSTASRREALTGYAFISPWLIGFLLFIAGPALASLVISFTRWNIVSDPRWVGLKNYNHIFTADKAFIQSLKVTFRYSVLYLPLTTIAGLATAMALNAKVKGVGIFRAMFYLPYVAPQIAATLVWMWMLNPRYGLINTVLSWLGIEGPNWFHDPGTALYGIIMISIWGVGGSAVIYLAGLQNIPPQLYDAAEVDGANSWQTFWNVTIPMLTPTIFFQLVVELIGVFQTFTAAFVATEGGPLKSTYFYMLHIYDKAWVSLRMGYASALAWILTLIILAFTLLIFKSSPFWVHYEAEQK